MKKLLRIVRRARRSFRGGLAWRLIVVIGVAIVSGTTAGVLPAVIGRAVGLVAGGVAAPPSRSVVGRLLAGMMPSGNAWAVVGVTLVATVVTIGIGVFGSKLGSALSGDVTAALRVELMRAVMGASPRDVTAAGQKISATLQPPGAGPPGAKPPPSVRGATREAVVRLAVTRESALVSDFAVSVMTGLPQSLATLLVLGVELVGSGAWIVLVGGIGLFLLSRLFADRASRRVGLARRNMQNADAAVFGTLQETLAATEDLRLWGAREQAVDEFAEVAHDCAAARSEFASALAISGQIKSVFTAMAPLLIVVALKVSGRAYSAGEVATLLLLVPLLMVRLNSIDAMRQGLIQRDPVLGATERLLDLKQAPARADDAVEVELSAVAGRIEFDAVSFTPPGARAPIIDDVSFDVPAGSVVGICGPSGCGKSTLLRLLLRLDDPNEGHIRLDKRDVSELEPKQLPALFGVVRQTSQLLQRPVRDSLGLGLSPVPSDDKMRRALEAVHMDELTKDDEGRDLDTSYRRNPPNFSGGECRRLLLARMLVGDARVCVLDEPEAGLPSATAEDILETIAEQAHGRTHLVVTHAPHLLKSDFNVVLDRGKLVGMGTHDELISSCTIYRDLLADALTGDATKGADA
jgi:ABC-type multidrug transport system fused ATPase/permease subunit